MFHAVIGLHKMDEIDSNKTTTRWDSPTSPALRPLPRIPQGYTLGDRPIRQVQRDQVEAKSPAEDEDSDADLFLDAQTSIDQPEPPNSDSPIPPRDELTQEIKQYLQQSMIERVYGDLLSGSRSRRYEPKWPMDLGTADAPLHEPGSQEEANSTFHELFSPLRHWHAVARGGQTDSQSTYRRHEILASLTEHRQNRAAKPPPENCTGNFLLYRNLLDAATETSVWSSINSAHVAIRRQDWDIADRRITKALILATKLRYDPLVAKCWYWRGIVAGALGDRKTAAECFLAAMPCFGVYEEGELLDLPVKEYKVELLGLLDQQEASEGQTEWSIKVRRGIIGTDGWFVPFRELFSPFSGPPADSEAEPPLSPPTVSLADKFGADYTHTGPITQSRSTSAEWNGQSATVPHGLANLDPELLPQMDESAGSLDCARPKRKSKPLSEDQSQVGSSQLRGNDEVDWYDEELFRPRNIDWNLMDKIDDEAKKFSYVSKETLYQLLQGCSPWFEESIQKERFTENFDNYPDIQHTVGWRVLDYCQKKAEFLRPRHTKVPLCDIEKNTIVPSTNKYTDPVLNKSTDDNSIGIDERSKQQRARVKMGPPLTIDTSNKDVPPLPVQTPSQAIMSALRPELTADEKVGGYVQALLHNNVDDQKERKSARRREIEKDPDWRTDHKDQQANFDRLVEEELKNPKCTLQRARKLVNLRNNHYLKEIWGPEGLRPPTPSPVLEAREQELTQENADAIKRFTAEMECNTYRSKWRAWSKLPKERRQRTAEPSRPSSTIAWLNEEYERLERLEGESLSPTVAAGAETSLDQPSSATAGFGLDGAKDELDQRDHGLQQPSSPDPEDSDDLPERQTSLDSIVSEVDSLRSDVYASLDRRPYEGVPRELKLLLGMTAMSEAMKRGRQMSEPLSQEDLIRLAEMAITMQVETVDEIGQVPLPKHDPAGGDTEVVGLGEVDLMVFSSDSEEDEDEDGEESDDGEDGADWTDDEEEVDGGEVSDGEFSEDVQSTHDQRREEHFFPPLLHDAPVAASILARAPLPTTSTIDPLPSPSPSPQDSATQASPAAIPPAHRPTGPASDLPLRNYPGPGSGSGSGSGIGLGIHFGIGSGVGVEAGVGVSGNGGEDGNDEAGAADDDDENSGQAANDAQDEWEDEEEVDHDNEEEEEEETF